MGSSGGAQTPVTQQTTQTKDPWGPAQGYLQQAMGAAAGLYGGNVGYQPYSGSTQVPEDPSLASGLNWQASQAHANLGGTPGIKAGQTLGLQQMQNYGLSPEMQSLYNQASTQENPYLQGVINQQVNQANAAASGAGRYGSGAHDAAIAQAIAPTLAQDYARRQQQRQDILTGGLQRAGQWSQLMPTLDEAAYEPAERLSAVGQYRTDRGQQWLSDQIKLYNAAQARDWEQLARFNAIIGGAGGLGGTQLGSTSTPLQQPSSTQRLFGGALAGAGMGSMFGPVGAGVGALGGGLLGML